MLESPNQGAGRASACGSPCYGASSKAQKKKAPKQETKQSKRQTNLFFFSFSQGELDPQAGNLPKIKFMKVIWP